MKHDLVLKQKKVLKIVSEYFKRKNSPFKKKILHFMKIILKFTQDYLISDYEIWDRVLTLKKVIAFKKWDRKSVH